MRQGVQETLDNCKKGDVVGLIHASDAYFFIRVLEIKTAKKIPFGYVSKKIDKEWKKSRLAECRKQYGAELHRSKAMVRVYVEK